MFFTFLILIWKRIKYEKTIVLFFSILFSYYIFGPNFKAKFWLIDDHEIFQFLGSESNPSGWPDFFSVLMDQTEVGLFGISTRYRPAYYILRLIEVFLWKDNSFLWYMFRFIIIVSFTYSLILLFRIFLTTPVALAWTFACFSFTYWADIYSRLGPGETYVTLGVAIYILTTFNWDKKIRQNLGSVILQVLALMIIIGSKENMFLMAFLPFFFFSNQLNEKWKFRYYHALYIIPILFGFLIVFAVIKAISINPVDVNGNSAQIPERLRKLFALIDNSLISQPLILFVLLGIVIAVKKSFIRFLMKFWSAIAILLFLIINILLNIVFYSGELPQNNRYDFPVAVFYNLYFVICLGLIIRIIFPKKIMKNRLFFSFVFLVFASFGFSAFAINEIQNFSRKNSKRTLALHQTIETLKFESKDNLGIIFVRNFTEFEPADSLLQYAKYYNLQFPFIMDVDDVKYYSQFQDGLMSYLRNLSLQGDITKNLKPLGNLKKENIDHCILFHFGEFSFNPNEKYPFCKEINQRLIVY
ncbi:hypothetical protein ND861_10910 [Leptospira sp. 2 VSF19]|uniref:Glycosyltransferase RgtA/B/C/D-like domain-containing protein n=1 Tax=Leptospira soteropolitanensis TaxID=2950025 RepID=A0AAW5VMA0_9LEPT|nr:hypothetical protein [Leptospira soteropolitanensis]MCW7500743.1 hypothetical protein [Leptospira soteropolitanensis]MCW7526855.1 hypothetical protein [Leptospira soteropolitanensis]MCW7530756.1 hypothetical protein [Leptospira soteropolitanensis]